MNKALALLLAACLATLTGACGTPIDEGSGTPKRPGVLLVVLDTTRADALSCYGQPLHTTPSIDRIAAQGTIYRRAYATSFWTLPSHASLLTGLYPTEAGATSETNYLPENVVTLAERLAAAGYRTGAVVRNAWLSIERGFGQGFGDFIEAWRGEDDTIEVEGEEAAVDSAVAWLEARASGEPEPFFLFVNLNVAHLPYTPPETVWQRFAPETLPSPERLQLLRSISGGWGHLAGALVLDATDLETLHSLYLAEVAVADSLVGRLTGTLEAHGVLDDTLVVITSDHGENLGEHGLIDHVYSMYDTTVRVPLIVRYPARFTGGTVVEGLVSLVDLTPTILDFCAATDTDSATDHGLSGRSLWEARGPTRTAVYAENGRPINGLEVLRRWFPAYDEANIDHPMRMVRVGRDKLIWKVGASAELYDLETDPHELEDRSASEAEVRNRLLGNLREWTAGLSGPPTAQLFKSRDAESLQRLRALGYVE